MAKERSGPPAKPEEVGALMNWLKDFFQQFQLAWRLLLDNRIPAATKIIPFATMAYLISPIDLVPDVALGLGQLDDIAILLIGLRLFIDVCPPDIVEEHRRELEGPSEIWTPPEEEVIDVEAKIPEKEKEEA